MPKALYWKFKTSVYPMERGSGGTEKGRWAIWNGRCPFITTSTCAKHQEWKNESV